MPVMLMPWLQVGCYPVRPGAAVSTVRSRQFRRSSTGSGCGHGGLPRQRPVPGAAAGVQAQGCLQQGVRVAAAGGEWHSTPRH